MKLWRTAIVLLSIASPATAEVDFDGNNDNLTHEAAVVAGYPFTACGWTKPAAVGSSDDVFTIGTSGTTDHRFSSRVTGAALAAALIRTTSTDNIVNSAATLSDGVYAHTCIRATSSSDVDQFLNGTKADGNPGVTPAGMNQTRFGENSNAAADFPGSVSHWAVWDVALSDGNITALAGGDNPLAVTASDLVAYWPFTADLNDVVGSFHMTANGNATLDNTTNAPVDPPPSGGEFDVNPTVTAQSTTDYTLGGSTDGSATIDAVACPLGAGTPDVAEIQGQDCDGGGAAIASASDTWNGADSMTLGGSLTFPGHDLSITDGTSVVNLDGEMLDVPAEKDRATLTSVDATSPFSGQGVAADDIVTFDEETRTVAGTPDPSGFPVTIDVDGTVSYAAGGSTERRFIIAQVYDFSTPQNLDFLLVFNNLGVNPDDSVFPEPFLWQKDIAIETLEVDELVVDPEGDDLVVTALEALPSGLAIASNDLDGTPDTCGSTLADIQWADEYGATYVEEIDIRIGDLVPDTSGMDEATAIAAIEAVCSFTATAGAPRYSSTVPVGEVVSTSPANGWLSPPDQEVTYFLSLGEDPGIESASRKVVFVLDSVAGLTKWADYIPVSAVPGCRAGTYENDGCWAVTVLSDDSGKTPWVDFTPVFEVEQTANKWRYENDGWIPVDTLTP